MGRLARIVAPGYPHHITQRGNRREAVFFADRDRLEYLTLLRRGMDRHGVDVWAYCLMTNHVHLLAVPRAADSLGLCLRDAHTAYALRLNRRRNLCGHLWQGRFCSTVLDEGRLWAAWRYIERNPVRAGVVPRAEDYPWSSAVAHCGRRPDPLLSPGSPWRQMRERIGDWGLWLRDEQEADLAVIRRHTRTGRPCGGEEFVRGLERILGRSLLPAKRGPKPKTKGTPGQLFKGQHNALERPIS